jgi:prepilin-type N-terminal cleavage/methylation domain-containing protein
MSRPACRPRGGFTLIEVLIAIVILGSVGVGIAQLMFTSARRSASAGAVAYRSAALATEVSRITALPAASLADGTTTQTVSSQPFPHTLTTVAATSGGLQTVTITVTPGGTRAIAARSRTITRAASGAATSPFGP